MPRKGIDTSDFRRKEDQQLFGCVITAIESAMGVEATANEKDYRLNLVNDRIDQWAKAIVTLNREVIENTAGEIGQEDKNDVRDYYQELYTHDSLLGKAIRKFDMNLVELKPNEIRDTILENKIVLLMTPNHIGHIIYVPETGFLSKSDNDRPVGLNEDDSYMIFIFTKCKNL
jgi:hypothetical protein